MERVSRTRKGEKGVSAVPAFPSIAAQLSTTSLIEAAAMMSGFILLLFLGSMVLPGRVLEGPAVNGHVPAYKLNGLLLFVLTMLLAGSAQFTGLFSLSTLQTHFAALFVVTNLFAFLLAGWLYWRGTRTEDSPRGFFGGYFFGVEHSPVWFGVNLKLFSYRPSLIALALFNVSFAVTQYEANGQLTLAMILYQGFTFLYVFNYFQFEYGMIHTWDLVSERFGWMLIWGDYVLVPFFYCISGWWLLQSPSPLPAPAAAALVLLFVFGFWLFRGANQQKHRFRRDPQISIWGKPVQTIQGRLLVSGFWGIGRHLNYTGEICVYFAFVLTTGFTSWVPFLLTAWLMGLLLHRSWRDERRCSAKYGALWEQYKQRARFSMIPFIY